MTTQLSNEEFLRGLETVFENHQSGRRIAPTEVIIDHLFHSMNSKIKNQFQIRFLKLKNPKITITQPEGDALAFTIYPNPKDKETYFEYFLHKGHYNLHMGELVVRLAQDSATAIITFIP